MNPSELNKALKKVGSEQVLHAMLVEMANAWDGAFLQGFPEHIASGGTIHNFFPTKNEDYYTEKSPIYFYVKRHWLNYKVTIGICFGGTCGEGAEFRFSRKFALLENEPSTTWIH